MFSPFTVTVTRDDRQQFLSKLSLRQPPGCSACSSACRSAARPTRRAAPARPPRASARRASSRGAGPQPFALSGPVYLTGPYNGAPVRPVDRDPRDRRPLRPRHRRGARGDPRRPGRLAPDDRRRRAAADPAGHPAAPARGHGRSSTAPGFIFNPSSCDPLAIHGTLTAVDGTVQEADVAVPGDRLRRAAVLARAAATADGKTSARTAPA